MAYVYSGPWPTGPIECWLIETRWIVGYNNYYKIEATWSRDQARAMAKDNKSLAANVQTRVRKGTIIDSDRKGPIHYENCPHETGLEWVDHDEAVPRSIDNLCSTGIRNPSLQRIFGAVE